MGVCSSREKVDVNGRRDTSFLGCTQVWLVSYAVRLNLNITAVAEQIAVYQKLVLKLIKLLINH